jgi:hypothetical protein
LSFIKYNYAAQQDLYKTVKQRLSKKKTIIIAGKEAPNRLRGFNKKWKDLIRDSTCIPLEGPDSDALEKIISKMFRKFKMRLSRNLSAERLSRKFSHPGDAIFYLGMLIETNLWLRDCGLDIDFARGLREVRRRKRRRAD